MAELPTATARPRSRRARVGRACRFHARRCYHEARALLGWRPVQAFAISLACTTAIALRIDPLAAPVDPPARPSRSAEPGACGYGAVASDHVKARAAHRMVDAFGAAVEHEWRSGLRCPTAGEVVPHTRYDSAIDPWGMPLVVVCSTDCGDEWTVPRGIAWRGRGSAGAMCHFGVFSAGPDGVTWTGDDIRSRNWSSTGSATAIVHYSPNTGREDPLP